MKNDLDNDMTKIFYHIAYQDLVNGDFKKAWKKLYDLYGGDDNTKLTYASDNYNTISTYLLYKTRNKDVRDKIGTTTSKKFFYILYKQDIIEYLDSIIQGNEEQIMFDEITINEIKKSYENSID